eukprot:TRINITY_DN8886_c0_g1_i1.p1 TRINITY_DN8886_c0_g1~~TRINITY_DN8886_c0_g1_i1.p1  ORF type:complete len:198 (+),score=42.89 TRINITY_DN8886_c0_g1_i1:67-660(+)
MGKFKKKAQRELQQKKVEQQLKDEPEQSQQSGFAKAAKRQLKREVFLQKLGEEQALKANKARRKKKAATPVVGDLTDLTTALASAEASETVPSRKSKARQRKRQGQEQTKELQVRSRKGRNLALAQEQERMKQVLHHPAFTADPLAAIKQHLQNTMAVGSHWTLRNRFEYWACMHFRHADYPSCLLLCLQAQNKTDS